MKKAVILGGKESGAGAAILAQKNGYAVFVSDQGKIPDQYQAELKQYHIEFEEEQHTESKILDADVVIKSPGIPDKAPLVQKLLAQNTPVISEIEFAGWFTKATIVGITGSNGKTTTTSLTYEVLKRGGLNVSMAGNIGSSFARQVALEDKDYYVLELSSFQLDGITTFRPHIAVLLNITEDHLDRYNYSFQNYIDSKFRIAQNQTPEDYFIYCHDDQTIINNIKNKHINSRQVPFSIKKKCQRERGSTMKSYLYTSPKNTLV